MIDNCRVFGADWRALTWWEYTARLAKWNEAQSTEKPPADAPRLRKLMEAH